VVDTNVLISGIVFGGIPEKILELAEENVVEIITSPEILNELRNVLKEKFGFGPEMIKIAVGIVKELSTVVNPGFRLKVIPGKESDNRIIECALEGKAQYIATGDRRHLLPLKEYGGG
jgi:putative PIN family toxin of toxin-antitoxin system